MSNEKAEKIVRIYNRVRVAVLIGLLALVYAVLSQAHLPAPELHGFPRVIHDGPKTSGTTTVPLNSSKQ